VNLPLLTTLWEVFFVDGLPGIVNDKINVLSGKSS